MTKNEHVITHYANLNSHTCVEINGSNLLRQFVHCCISGQVVMKVTSFIKEKCYIGITYICLAESWKSVHAIIEFLFLLIRMLYVEDKWQLCDLSHIEMHRN